MPHLFCYGSLMFRPVWSRVVRGRYDYIDARLYGFQRRGVQGETYPCLIPGRVADCVEGILYFHIDSADVVRLDEFEGNLYDRQTVTCIDELQCFHTAEVYVLNCRDLARATGATWDEQWFVSKGLAQFLGALWG